MSGDTLVLMHVKFNWLDNFIVCFVVLIYIIVTVVCAVAPICYAHLAASQVGQFLKFDDMSDTSSGHGSITSVGSAQVTPLPRLHKNVMNSMFFC